MANRIAFGNHGEEVASNYIKKLHYRILERNYRCKFGEIDIIALDKKTLVFIEVKTRSSRIFGSPETAVTFRKQRQMKRAALCYIQGHNLFDQDARFDVVAVESDAHGEKISIIRNAFEISP